MVFILLDQSIDASNTRLMNVGSSGDGIASKGKPTLPKIMPLVMPSCGRSPDEYTVKLTIPPLSDLTIDPLF